MKNYKLELTEKEKDVLIYAIQHFSSSIIDILKEQKKNWVSSKWTFEMANHILNIKWKIILWEK